MPRMPRRANRTNRALLGASWALAAGAVALTGCASHDGSTTGTSAGSAAASAAGGTSTGGSSAGSTSGGSTSAAALPSFTPETGSTPTPVDRSVAHPDGLLVQQRIAGFDSRLEPVQVWLPPQYFQPAMKDHRFPVLLGLGAMHASGESFIKTTHAVDIARAAVASGKVAPFIGVYLPSRIAFDVDSECVDLPGLPSQSVYTQQVVQAITASYATVAPGKGWFTEGYSTGGQCAALLQARHPDIFTASASVGGYFTPIFDGTASRLATQQLTDQNSPLWLVRHQQLQRLDLLSISSAHDQESWGRVGGAAAQGEGDGAQFHAAARHLPGLEFLMAKGNGHTREGYQPYWQPALEWLGRKGL